MAKSCQSQTPLSPFNSLKCQFCSLRCQLSPCCHLHIPENIKSFPVQRTTPQTLLPIPLLPCTLILSHASPHSSLKPILTHIQAPALSSALVSLHSLHLTRGMQPELNLARIHQAGACSRAQPAATPACASTTGALHHPGYAPTVVPISSFGATAFSNEGKTKSFTSSPFHYDFSPTLNVPIKLPNS